MNSESNHRSPLSVVFLHGLFGAPANWQSAVEHLSPNFDTHAPELPVLSAPPQHNVLEFIVQFVRDYLDRLDIQRAVLVGNSLGGHVAARIALHEPGRVTGLVLAGSSGLFERGLERHVPRRPDRVWLRKKIAEVFFDPARVTDEMIDDVAAVVHDRRSVLQLVRAAQSAKRDNLAPLLPLIFCPALLVWGGNDRITPLETARDFHRLLPHSELRIIPDCGHAPMMEQPAEFNQALMNFISFLTSSVRPRLQADGAPVPDVGNRLDGFRALLRH